MPLPSVLIYRFAFGSLFMLLYLVARRISLRLGWGDALRLSFLSLLYTLSGVALFTSYSYMPSGIATTLLFAARSSAVPPAAELAHIRGAGAGRSGCLSTERIR